ncbi:MAG: alpha/beta family hydrolase [Dermatophilaceae bacterium]
MRGGTMRRDPGPPSKRTVATPYGPARAHLWTPAGAIGALVLGHGAGGSSWSADLLALTSLASRTGGTAWQVVLVEQPWRVAGRRVAAPPPHLDAAWLAVLASLTRGPRRIAAPRVLGGRSAGARVACRTARHAGADAVLALAFPLHPPGKPGRSRGTELAGALIGPPPLPTLVVQGRRDPFGTPDEIAAAVPGVPIVEVAGTHSFAAPQDDVIPAVTGWLDGLGR